VPTAPAKDQVSGGARSFGHPQAWSPDGAWLASGGDDKTVRVWDAKAGQLVRILSGHTDRVMAVGWSPTGREIVSVGDGGKLILWANQELSIQLDELAAVSWTASGIAVGGSNGVAVFDLR
jgi:WD40 repeat protein